MYSRHLYLRRRRPAHHAGLQLIMDDVDLSEYQCVGDVHVDLRPNPYAAMVWDNKGGDVDAWYRQRAGKQYEYIVRQIFVQANKSGKCFMVFVGTLDGRPRNVVMSAEYQHGGNSLHWVRELRANIGGKRVVHNVRIKIPCRAYSTDRKSAVCPK